MRKFCLALLSILSVSFSFAQYANNWQITTNIGLNFNPNPVMTPGGQVPATHYDNSSTISDASGNLLFYTDGQTVWNKNHLVMPNGSGLIGSNTAGQNALIVPIPCSTTQYVIFHVTEFATPGQLHYSVVDMSLASGLGDVVSSQKNISLGTSGWTEKLCAYYNPSINAYWMLTHRFGSNQFVAFKVDKTSIATTSVVSAVGTANSTSATAVGGANDAQGQLTISPDGQKVFNAITYADLYEVFDFNSTTGVVSNPITINGDGQKAFSTAFSPDSKKIYFSSVFGGNFYQADISVFTSTAVNASKNTVFTSTVAGAYKYGYIELAPNGKIYITRPNTSLFEVINNPNLTGAACSFSFGGFSVSPGTIRWGISRIAYNIQPPPQPFTISSLTSSITCNGSANGSATISASTSSAVTYSWSPGSYSTSVANNLNAGTYTVTVSDGICTTTSTVINILQPQPISLNLSPSQIICNGNSAILNSTVSGGTPAYTYSWSNGSPFSGVSVSPVVQTTYTLNISDVNGCTMSAATTVSVTDCTNIRQYETDNTVSVYPNPFSGTIFIKSQEPTDEIIVTNVLGETIKKVKFTNGNLNCGELQNGIYFLQLYNKNKLIANKRIVKTN